VVRFVIIVPTLLAGSADLSLMIHTASLRPYQQPVSRFATADEHMSARTLKRRTNVPCKA
jgi:hypothetical protein